MYPKSQHCTVPNLKVEYISRIFNFSVKTRSREWVKRNGQRSMMVSYNQVKEPENDLGFLGAIELMGVDVFNGIIYCRGHNSFGSSWNAWVIPFEPTVCLNIFLTISLLSVLSLKFGIIHVLTEAYFIFSLLVRQPIRNYTGKYAIFALLSLIFSWSYESLLMGSLTVPSKPKEYHSLKEFLKAYKKILFAPLGIRYEVNAMLLKNEFIKSHLVHEFNSTFQIDLSILTNPEFRHRSLFTSFISKQLFDEKDPSGRYLVIDVNRLSIMLRIIASMSRRNDYPCSSFSVAVVYAYEYFMVSFVKEAKSVNSAFTDSGIMLQWHELYRNPFEIRSRHMKHSID